MDVGSHQWGPRVPTRESTTRSIWGEGGSLNCTAWGRQICTCPVHFFGTGTCTFLGRGNGPFCDTCLEHFIDNLFVPRSDTAGPPNAQLPNKKMHQRGERKMHRTGEGKMHRRGSKKCTGGGREKCTGGGAKNAPEGGGKNAPAGEQKMHLIHPAPGRRLHFRQRLPCGLWPVISL